MVKAEKKNEILLHWIRQVKTAGIPEMKAFLHESGRDISESTLRVELTRAVKQGKLHRVGTGRYAWPDKSVIFSAYPEQLPFLTELAWYFKGRFPFVRFCVWETGLISPMMLHVPAFRLGILEVDRDALQAVWEDLQEQPRFQEWVVREQMIEWISPKKKSGAKGIIVLKPMLKGSPLQEVEGLPIPAIEKLFVDLELEKEFFAFLQGQDLEMVQETLAGQYVINAEKLLAYARDRNRYDYFKEKLYRLNLIHD